ncbi:MAG: RagB/SusD family nutrient uptake outer membrane protein, partial [Flavitalea sp.]
MRYSYFKIGGWALFVFIVLQVSCGKKKVDLAAPSVTEDTYYNSEVSFTKTVYGIYARLTDWYNYNGGAGAVQLPVMANLPGDDVTVTSSDPFEHFGPLNASDGRNSGFFTSAYQVVSRANTLLQKQSQESGVYQTPNLKANHRGEALFLRSLAFYYLWNFYGKAPLVTERITTVEQWTTPESQGTQMIDTVIRDLQEAANILPATWPASQRGRATKNSANGLLAKALMARAAFGGDAADYTAAVAAVNAITGAQLVSNFDDNFAVDTENNTESLFEFQASATPGDNVWLPNEFDAAIGRMGYYSGFYDNNWALFGAAIHTATQKLFDAFDPADPRRNLTL